MGNKICSFCCHKQARPSQFSISDPFSQEDVYEHEKKEMFVRVSKLEA